MIKVEMTVFEMVTLCSIGINSELQARIIAALEKAVEGGSKPVEDGSKLGNNTFTLHSLRHAGNFIECIKILRKHTGMGLKEAKTFMDVVRGEYHFGDVYTGGKPNTLTGYNEAVCSSLANDLREIGEWDVSLGNK